jgi:mycothiol synthase
MRKERRDESGQLLELEADPASAEDVADASTAGLTLVRCVEQLRVALPLPSEESLLATRPFVPGADDDAFLTVNNRAFAWHLDQSNWTVADLRKRIDESWFDPNGFLLHEVNGKLAGFCWTKIHPETDCDPELGEIFVIAVDPEFHGQGLGRALTHSGLASLWSRSVQTGMLHVEHDNVAAQSLYRDLGFHLHNRHCWWAKSESAAT